MAIYILIILIIVMFGIKVRNDDSEEILNYIDTTTINGICVLFIFISHSTQYWRLSDNWLDSIYQHIQNIHNQWVVVPFLAFSGYGVMYSFLHKENYILTYPRKRILRTLLNFDLAVVLYLIVELIIGEHYSLETVLGSFIGVTSVGNSNWYIFAILIMYTCSYFTVRVTNKSYLRIIMLFVEAGIYWIIMETLGFGERFYSTIMCYPAGAAIAFYKDKITNTFKDKRYFSLSALTFLILITYKLRFNPIVMNLSSIILIGCIVWFLCFFKIRSVVLYFFGKHAFSIFILQRIPGILLNAFITNESISKYIWIIVDFLITILIALIYDALLKKLYAMPFFKRKCQYEG